MAYGSPSTAVPSAARTTSGNSGTLSISDKGDLINLLVDVSATAGTPTLDISVEWSNDGTIWAAAESPDAFTQITSTTSVVKTFDIKAAQYRVVWDIAGTTPSFTFSVTAYVTK